MKIESKILVATLAMAIAACGKSTQEDVDKAAQGARSTEGDSPPLPALAQAQAPAPAQNAASAFPSALRDAGVNDAAARVIADYVTQEFTDEQRAKATQQLRNLDTQVEARQKLWALTEKALGEPLPREEEDASIPF